MATQQSSAEYDLQTESYNIMDNSVSVLDFKNFNDI